MIFALEGPDCCGKSTLLAALQKRAPHLRFVPSMRTPKELMPAMSQVEFRQHELWKHLYDPAEKYVCDRFVATSAWVYDRLFGRPNLVPLSAWTDELVMLYIDVPKHELLRRYRARGDDLTSETQISEMLVLYASLSEAVRTLKLVGTKSPQDLAEDVYAVLRYA